MTIFFLIIPHFPRRPRNFFNFRHIPRVSSFFSLIFRPKFRNFLIFVIFPPKSRHFVAVAVDSSALAAAAAAAGLPVEAGQQDVRPGTGRQTPG
jgi:hypothetical protein